MSKPNVMMPAWKKSPAWERARDSLTFLHVHGFLSDAERDKAFSRIRKWVDKSIVEEAHAQAS